MEHHEPAREQAAVEAPNTHTVVIQDQGQVADQPVASSSSTGEHSSECCLTLHGTYI